MQTIYHQESESPLKVRWLFINKDGISAREPSGTGKVLWQIRLPLKFGHASKDGRSFFFGGGVHVLELSSADGITIKQYRTTMPVHCLTSSGDGRSCAFGLADGTIEWHTADGADVRYGSENAIQSIDMLHDHIITVNDSRCVDVWNRKGLVKRLDATSLDGRLTHVRFGSTVKSAFVGTAANSVYFCNLAASSFVCIAQRKSALVGIEVDHGRSIVAAVFANDPVLFSSFSNGQVHSSYYELPSKHPVASCGFFQDECIWLALQDGSVEVVAMHDASRRYHLYRDPSYLSCIYAAKKLQIPATDGWHDVLEKQRGLLSANHQPDLWPLERDMDMLDEAILAVAPRPTSKVLVENASVEYLWVCDILYLSEYITKSSGIQDDFSRKILRLKDRYADAIHYFTSRLEPLLKQDITIVTVPSHTPSSGLSGLDIVADRLAKSGRIWGKGALIRVKPIQKLSTGGDRSQDVHFDSIKVGAPELIRGRDILLLDDVTTTGNSLLACKQILLDAGAASVECLALGKTI